MTPRSSRSADDTPANLEVEVTDGVVTGFPDVCSALKELRGGFVALVADLEPDEWRRPSRCHLWNVHDVVRHVRDGSKLHLAMLHGDPPVFHPDDPFENREAPLRWLADSVGEQPHDTMRDLERVTPAELDAVAACAERGGDESFVGPYGRAHWTVLSTHVFWDSWLHRRDIAQPLQRPDLSTPRQDVVAALYALLVASIPCTVTDPDLDTTVRLTTDSRAVDAHVRPAHVTLEPARPHESTDLEGELGAVVDALAGRGSEVEHVLAGEPARQAPFTRLRHFMTPSAS